MKSVVAAPLVIFLCIALWPTQLFAQQTSRGVAYANKLLTDLWDGDVDTQRAAEATWQQSQSRVGTVAPLVRWSYVLNRIDYDKYREARAAIEPLAAQGSTNWDQRYTKIWLQASVGEIDTALLEMQQLKTDLDATANVDETTRFKLFARMGRLFGYIEGPGSDRATPRTVQDTLAILTDGLNDTDFGNFEDQRRQTVQKFADLINETIETAARKRLERQQKHQTKTAQLITDSQDMEQRKRDIVSELGQIRTEANNEIQQLRDTARPIETRLQGIDSRLRESDVRLSRLGSDARRFESLAFYEPDPCRRDDLIRRARALLNDVYVEENYRAGVQAEYDSVAAQLNLVNDQIASIQQQVASEAGTLEQESRQMVKLQRRNDRELKKLQRPLIRKTGYERTMTARTGHLPTYDPFPANELRQKVLKKFP